jgi:SAM-dependent methyltransferase
MDNSKFASYEKHLQESKQYWDQAASNFDDEPDHGLRDPSVYKAWIALLNPWFPPVPATVLDIGCGTGSLSVALAGLGYKVTGVDLSPAMINLAKAKTIMKGLGVEFHIMDAAFPGLAPGKFDTILCRHLLWALPEPDEVLQRWTGLLKRNGKLILVEGFWGAGGGLHFKDVVKMIPASFTSLTIENLSDYPDLWGRNVSDERYAIIADLRALSS